MPTNAFEDSRIAEGTMHNGAQHIANMPGQVKTPQAPRYESDYDPGKEFIDGHPVKKTPLHRVLGVTTLAGAGVRNPAGDSLGRIEDIMIELASGRIAYAVLSFGGLFGIGSKLFVLPWTALTFDQRANEFVLDVARELLEKGPGFERDNWPDMADPAYGAGIHLHYGKKPYWENTMTDFGGDEFTANRCR